jgi:hypothetical protein
MSDTTPDSDDAVMENQKQVAEPEIQVTVPLDPIHEHIYDSLSNAGLDVEQSVSEEVGREVEEALYDILQRVKYQE